MIKKEEYDLLGLLDKEIRKEELKKDIQELTIYYDRLKYGKLYKFILLNFHDGIVTNTKGYKYYQYNAKALEDYEDLLLLKDEVCKLHFPYICFKRIVTKKLEHLKVDIPNFSVMNSCSLKIHFNRKNKYNLKVSVFEINESYEY